MNICMQTLGKFYREQAKLDYDYDFYERYLLPYVGNESENGLVAVSLEDASSFAKLNEVYSEMVSVPAEQRSEAEKLADSLKFFIASGTIMFVDGEYYVDLEKLQTLNERYQGLALEKGKALTKGGASK